MDHSDLPDFLEYEQQDLKRDYESVASQLRTEQDGPTENKLRRKLEELQKKLDSNEAARRARRQELQQASTKQLLDILHSHANQLDAIQEAFQQTLRQWPCQVNAAVEQPAEMLQELCRIPKGEARHSALEGFAAYLLQLAQDTDLIAAVQSWGDRAVQQWPALVAQAAEMLDTVQQSMQPALLISIARSEQASAERPEANYYRLRAFLIDDIARYREAKQGYRLLSLPERQHQPDYALTDLLEQAPELIRQFLEKGSSSFYQDPEIHIFLPFELLNLPVDSWQFPVSSGRPKPIGHSYRVLLHSQERVSRSYIDRGRWRQRWNSCQGALEKLAHEVFVAGNDQDLDDLYEALDELGPDVVGLKVTQAPCQLEPDGLFGAVLQAGLPLAIWSRCDLRTCSTESELDRLLQASCLSALPEAVQAERKQARKAKGDEDHIGHHLAILWDDPNLVPPKSA